MRSEGKINARRKFTVRAFEPVSLPRSDGGFPIFHRRKSIAQERNRIANYQEMKFEMVTANSSRIVPLLA